MTIRALAAVALAAISTFSAVGPAVAAEPGYVSRSVTVRTGDLNLSTEAGLSALNNRVAVAVHKVCGAADPMDLNARVAVASCREGAQRSAKVRVAALIEDANRPAIAMAGR